LKQGQLHWALSSFGNLKVLDWRYLDCNPHSLFKNYERRLSQYLTIDSPLKQFLHIFKIIEDQLKAKCIIVLDRLTKEGMIWRLKFENIKYEYQAQSEIRKFKNTKWDTIKLLIE